MYSGLRENYVLIVNLATMKAYGSGAVPDTNKYKLNVS